MNSKDTGALQQRYIAVRKKHALETASLLSCPSANMMMIAEAPC